MFKTPCFNVAWQVFVLGKPACSVIQIKWEIPRLAQHVQFIVQSSETNILLCVLL